MNNKHAYLIIAHNEFDILEKQLLLLDDDRNDLYIHIDKKVLDFDFQYWNKLIKKSNLFFVDRVDVKWGDFSQVECELTLLRAATPKKYKYYHLISGVDMPIKTQNETHNFFDKNSGLEFIHFFTKEPSENVKDRVLRYHYFLSFSKHKNKFIGYFFTLVRHLLVKSQRIFNIKRKWDQDIKIMYGANWFSITNELAEYVLSKEHWINTHFKHTACGDEIFLQTIVYNSDFKDRLYLKDMNNNYKSCMRYIDWNRGCPYVFKKSDFNELINSDMLFARKFSSKVDSEIVNELFQHLK